MNFLEATSLLQLSPAEKELCARIEAEGQARLVQHDLVAEKALLADIFAHPEPMTTEELDAKLDALNKRYHADQIHDELTEARSFPANPNIHDD